MMSVQSHLEDGLIKGNGGGSELQEVGSPPRPTPRRQGSYWLLKALG